MSNITRGTSDPPSRPLTPSPLASHPTPLPRLTSSHPSPHPSRLASLSPRLTPSDDRLTKTKTKANTSPSDHKRKPQRASHASPQATTGHSHTPHARLDGGGKATLPSEKVGKSMPNNSHNDCHNPRRSLTRTPVRRTPVPPPTPTNPRTPVRPPKQKRRQSRITPPITSPKTPVKLPINVCTLQTNTCTPLPPAKSTTIGAPANFSVPAFPRGRACVIFLAFRCLG